VPRAAWLGLLGSRTSPWWWDRWWWLRAQVLGQNQRWRVSDFDFRCKPAHPVELGIEVIFRLSLDHRLSNWTLTSPIVPFLPWIPQWLFSAAPQLPSSSRGSWVFSLVTVSAVRSRKGTLNYRMVLWCVARYCWTWAVRCRNFNIPRLPTFDQEQLVALESQFDVGDVLIWQAVESSGVKTDGLVWAALRLCSADVVEKPLQPSRIEPVTSVRAGWFQ